MASLEPVQVEGGRRAAFGGTGTLITFAGSLFVSALLLFAVQPMFAKMVLPRLGGSPGVWSVAMVFFQATLLLGYAYAHVLTRSLGIRNGVVVHLLFLSATMLLLPIAVAEGWSKPPVEGQSFWLIGLFGVSVGLPFFAVATTGPLLQYWFSKSGHKQAADPYFLYGASNLGSFAALILYPVLFEPVFVLGDQSLLWSVGFIALAVLIGTSALLVMGPAGEASPAAEARTTAPPAWRERLAWVGLAFIPSALLVAVTAHIATDIASAPFLWVIPLALYLLTFVITFQRKPIIPHPLMLRLLPLLIAPLAVLVAAGGATNLVFLIFIHLSFFFVAAMVCHGEMVRMRPPAENLTEFYLWMSFGGVLGGIFSGLVAPHIFSNVFEYPILVVASLIALPALRAVPPGKFATQLILVAVLALLAMIPSFFGVRIASDWYLIALGIFALAVMILNFMPAIQFGLVIALMIFAGAYQPELGTTRSYRSFFGVNKVVDTADGRFRALIHGSTVHGAQRLLNEDGTVYAGPPQPTAYYYFGGPLGLSVEAARSVRGTLGNVGVVGLGTGSLACHAKPGEAWTFYEIDAEVERIARDPANFSFLSGCGKDQKVVLGDARLTIADEPDRKFDMLVLDAFSSDAVPVHLLTREALHGYFNKLKPGGIVAFHISNRYLDLAPIVAASAEANGLKTWLGKSESEEMDLTTFNSGSVVAVVARDDADIGPLATADRWTEVAPDRSIRTWTDDYSNVLGAMIRRFQESE